MFRKLWKLSLLLLTAVGAFLIYKFAFLMPDVTESVYAQTIYPFFTQIIGNLTKLVSFSVGELFLYIFAAYLIFGVVFTFFSFFKPKGRKLYHFCKRILTLAIVICMVYSSFILNWGINYARKPLADTMGLEIQEATVAELKDTAIKLADKANSLRQQVSEDANGVFALTHSKEIVLETVQNVYDACAPEYMNLGVKTRVKGVLTPNLLSTFRTTGIFSPFTYEANVNMQMPELYFPAVAAHEYAHLKGFAREDEASFVAWYVCSKSEDTDFAYSAYAYALTYVINALYDVSPADHQEVVSLLDEGILRDFANENEYWQDFESDLADTGEQIYDSYLQNNGVSDGRKSYGRMIDLIIALNREGEL